MKINVQHNAFSKIENIYYVTFCLNLIQHLITIYSLIVLYLQGVELNYKCKGQLGITWKRYESGMMHGHRTLQTHTK